MTVSVTTSSASRAGNGVPPGSVSGSASAAASETTPRIPAQASTSEHAKASGRLRRRWGRTHIRDWASDVAVLLDAECALLLGDEPEQEMAIVQLLPFRGRQAVLGTPSFSLGSYDELLGRVAEHRGDMRAAAEWWRGARRQGVLVGSPHQVALADSHLARVPGEIAV